MRIADSTIQAVRDLPAETVISYYQQLKPQSGRHTGLCPFHDDHKTGSFYVFEHTNTYKCFSCGAFGDPIRYVMERNRVSFYDAIQDIAQKAGILIEVENSRLSPQEQAAAAQKKHSVEQALLAAQDYFQQHRQKGHEYLAGRGFREETASFFGLGYAPDYNHFTRLHAEAYVQADLVKEKEDKRYDTLRDRLTIPLHNRHGQLIGFAGRALNPEAHAKYLNPTDTPLYSKKETLYNLNNAQRAMKADDRVYIVEGYPNVWRAYEHGILNIVATCGTSLTKEQISILLRYTKNVVLVYDGDQAGQKAFYRSLPILLAAGAYVRLVEMPEGLDLDEVLKDPEAARFTPPLRDNEKSWEELYIRKWQQLHEDGKEDLEKNVALTNEVANLICQIPDPISAKQHTDKLSKTFKSLRKAVALKEKARQNGDEDEEIKRVTMSETGTWIMNQRGVLQPVCDYQIKLLYQLTIPNTEDCDWILELKRKDQQPEIVVVPNRDMVSVQAIETAFYARRYAIDLEQKQARYLRAYLLEQGLKVAYRVDKLGYDQQSGLFFYANVAYDPVNKRVLKPNDLDIVDTPQCGYFMPYVDQLRSPKDKIVIRHDPEQKMDLSEVSRFVVQSWGETESLAIAFYIATLYMDIIVRKLRNFPILFLKGPGGSGKSELAKLLMDFAGPGVGDKISVGANSSTAAMKEVFSAYSNICVHLEDYSRSQNIPELSDFLVLLFDRNFRKTMDMDNRKQVRIMEPAASCVVSSNAPPLEDGSEALASRLIYLQLGQNKRETEDKIDFIKTRERLKAKNWTSITNFLLGYRSAIEETFDSHYKRIIDKLSKDLKALNLEVNDRIIASYATILAPIHELYDRGVVANFLPYDNLSEAMYNIAKENIKKQQQSLVSVSPLQEFWGTFQDLVDEFRTAEKLAGTWRNEEGVERQNRVAYNPYFIYPMSHYQIWENHSVGGLEVIGEPVIRLNLAAVHGKYTLRMKNQNKTPILNINQLKDALRGHRSYIPDVSEHYVKYRKIEGEKGGNVRLSYILKYEDICEDFNVNLNY